MKGKKGLKIRIIIIVTIILIIIGCLYWKKNEESNPNNRKLDFTEMGENFDHNRETKQTIVSTTSEVASSLSENIALHATYYLEECYVETNQSVKKGENILQYTNGTYMTAPYDCVITEINIPEEGEKCTNDHAIQISSVNSLQVQIGVDEEKINSINLGQEATIEISAYENKVLEGYVTHISSTASNSRFTVTVEFENDGDIMLGMTANVEIEQQ